MSNSERSGELDAILASHLEAAEAGKEPDREELVRRHPQFADELRRFFADVAVVERIAAPLRPPADPPAAPAGGSAETQPVLFGEGGLVSVPGYDILGELGRGGMGVVYKARHHKLNRDVALKMLLSGAHAGAADLARFKTEAEAVARLQHPNIVQVHEVGEHEGRPFLALEFCPGGSLEKKLNGTPLPPKEAAQLVETLARAVHAAHREKVIHRDLKPSNVLLTADGSPKISDFGLARKLDDIGQTQSGAVLGTPSYMAPEQASGKTKGIGSAADVYALGAILYECLTGRPPFKAATAVDTILQVLADEPVPPRQLQPRTPRDVETICLKCLQKESKRRYATAEALADDLSRFVRGEPVLARPVGRIQRAAKWCRRKPALAIMIAAVTLTMATGTAVSTLFGLYARDQATLASNREKDANQKATDLAAALADKAKSEDRVLTAMARSLLRPLQQKDLVGQPPLSDPEINALWELASSPENDLHIRVIEEALRGSGPTRRLKDRAAFALQAAVGLDAARRTRVEQLLGDRLQAEATPPDQQRDVALTLAQLGVRKPALAGKAALTLTQAMSIAKDPNEFLSLTQGLSALAARMEPTEAAAVLTQEMAKTTDDKVISILAHGLLTVASRMEPKAAAAVLTQEMTKTTDILTLLALAQGLSTLAPRLGPEEAGAAAAVLTQAMARTKDDREASALAQGLSAIAPRMEPTAAAAVLTQEMAKTTDPYALQTLARGLSAVAGRMGPMEAAVACGQAAKAFTRAIANRTNSGPLRQLREGLSAVAVGLGPTEAAETAAVLTQEMAKTDHPDALKELAEGLSAVAARMGPMEAAATCGHAAAVLTREMAKTTDPYVLETLARGLSAAAGRMGPTEAAATCGHAAAVLIREMDQTDHPDTLTEGLSALAPRLGPQEAGEAAAALAQEMAKMNRTDELRACAKGLAALGTRMEPKEAAAACAAAATIFARELGQTTDSAQLEELAAGLAALTARMEPKEAAAACAAAAATMTRAMATTTEPVELRRLAFGLSSVTPGLGPKEAGEAAAALTREMAKTRDDDALGDMGRCMSAAASRLGPKEAEETARALTQAMGKTMDSNQLQALAWGLSAVTARLEPSEAAAACDEAAATLTQALPRASKSNPLWGPAWGLWALAPRLSRKEAAKAAAALNQAMYTTTDGSSLQALVRALTAAAARLELKEAGRVAASLTQDMATTPDPFANWAESLSEVLSRLSPTERQRRVTSLAAVVALPANGGTPIGSWPVLQPALEPLPSGLPTPQLVELLKNPLCVNEARRVVLDELGSRYGRRFDDQWDFVQFAEEQKLGLDLTSPPQRPE